MTPTWNDYKSWLEDCLLSKTSALPVPPKATEWITDSRSIKAGTWFVPIVGDIFDGHDFIDQAVEAGATGFLYQASSQNKISAKNLASGLMVTDTLVAYQRLASGWRQTLSDTVVSAITGSVGKTTTKEMIACVFRKAGRCFSTAGSFNNEIGVPKSLLQIDQEDKFAILEFGAKRLGNIHFLCDMAKPDVAILLNVGVAHLGIFGSLENLRKTKMEIFRDSPNSTILVANHDDPEIFSGARSTGKKLLTFGYHSDATVALRSVKKRSDLGVTEIEICYGSKLYPLVLNSCHEAFPVNAAAALAAGIAAGIAIGVAIAGLEDFRPIAGRYRIMSGPKLIAVDDTYNANPESMKAGLASVFAQYHGKKVGLMLGDMLELGDDGPQMHEDIGRFLKQFKFCKLITVGHDAELIQKGYGDSLRSEKTHNFASVGDAIGQSEIILDDIDVLFVKGSNGIGLKRFLEHLQSTGILA